MINTNLRKKIFLISLFCFLPLDKFCKAYKGRFGIKISPGMTLNNVKPKEINSDAGLSVTAGMLYDWDFREHHYIGTGVYYAHKIFYINKKNESFSVGVDFLEFPILIKLFSNEIAIDTELFLYTGFIFDLKVNESVGKTTKYDGKSVFKPFLVNFGLGGGLEYEFAMNTCVFADLGWRVGLYNFVKKSSAPTNGLKNLICHTLEISIGIRF